MRINADDLVKVVEEELELATKGMVEEINDRVKEIADAQVKTLKTTSPRSQLRGKHYADGWAVKKGDTDRVTGLTSYTIYNKTKPQLTHLLEHGHAIAGGMGRVAGIPHIAPVEDAIAKEIERIAR